MRGARPAAQPAPAIVPASFGRRGAGARIRYTIVDSPAGRMLIAAAERGICALMPGADDATLERELRHDYRAAAIVRNDTALRDLSSAVLAHLRGKPYDDPLVLELRYTPFQLAVWQALCGIERGGTRTYGEIARRIGSPGAARAVGRAGALNPVAILIPCHRAKGADGRLHGYRWGLGIKRWLLDYERGLSCPGYHLLPDASPQK